MEKRISRFITVIMRYMIYNIMHKTSLKHLECRKKTPPIKIKTPYYVLCNHLSFVPYLPIKVRLNPSDRNLEEAFYKQPSLSHPTPYIHY